jgi:hypothetical protein
VRQEAVATSSTFTQSGDGNGLATAPMAPTPQSTVTSQVKERHSATRKGCTARIGTKVSATKNATMKERYEGRGAEDEEIEADDVPDGGEADEIAVLGFALLVGHMEQARQDDGDAGRQAEGFR